VRGGGNTAHTPFVTTEKTSEMKYYFILTDGRDAWVQFVYLPTQDEASGYIRDLRSVGISVHGYNLWNKDTRPIAERTLERVLGWEEKEKGETGAGRPPPRYFLS